MPCDASRAWTDIPDSPDNTVLTPIVVPGFSYSYKSRSQRLANGDDQPRCYLRAHQRSKLLFILRDAVGDLIPRSWRQSHLNGALYASTQVYAQLQAFKDHRYLFELKRHQSSVPAVTESHVVERSKNSHRKVQRCVTAAAKSGQYMANKQMEQARCVFFFHPFFFLFFLFTCHVSFTVVDR